MSKYTIGVDYGTLSGRAVLVDVETGAELNFSVYDYPHAVMDKSLPSGKNLPHDWALQHPKDYLDVLKHTIPDLLQKTKIPASDIIGIGVDFTACTVLPVKADGTPLCFLPEYEDHPHAYVKLWKHHAAQYEANKLNQKAREMQEEWLEFYGGKISSEWLFPKLMQVADEAPEIYEAMDFFIEAADWIVWQLTGVQSRNSCTAGYKAIWRGEKGYPSNDFFKSLNPLLDGVLQTKLNCPVSPIGSMAGEITDAAAKLTGLKPGTAVAVGNIDAHVCVPSVKIGGSGKMLAIMGTSTCHMLMDEKEVAAHGMCGVVKDGILPGFFGYEAGQSCVGDHFAWFIDNCLPAAYYEDAKEIGLNIHRYLREKAEKLQVGESGLVALDWWNGNRSVLVDVDLTGMIIGMTLSTKPEEIYRALIEATAFGTKMIIETFKEQGVTVREFYAAGGISQKDPMTMQIYADVINMPVYIAGSAQGPALGAAIFGALAAGSGRGGYDNISDAAEIMGKLKDTIYLPNNENAERYEKLYQEYKILHDYFGRGANDVMKRLKALKKSAKSGNATEE